jgi:hypothetical protein
MTDIWASKSLVPAGHKLSAVDAETDRHDFERSGSDLFGIKNHSFFWKFAPSPYEPILPSNDNAIS